jgi:hypothetical protein
MCPQGQGAQERLPRARTTAGWSWAPTCGSRAPRGHERLGQSGGPDLPSHQGGGPVPPRAPEEAAAKSAPPRVLWQPAFYEKAAQLPH